MKKRIIFAIFLVLILGANFLSALNRDYYAPCKEDREKDIHYIINTMGAATHTYQLALKVGKLTSAGDRIQEVHPLKYLKIVFTDEKLKVGLGNIRKSSSLWSSFLNGHGKQQGIVQTFQEEYLKKNVTKDQFKDFIAGVKIDPKFVSVTEAAYNNQQWEQFIDLLIKNVPRTGNSKKYDM